MRRASRGAKQKGEGAGAGAQGALTRLQSSVVDARALQAMGALLGLHRFIVINGFSMVVGGAPPRPPLPALVPARSFPLLPHFGQGTTSCGPAPGADGRGAHNWAAGSPAAEGFGACGPPGSVT